MSDLFLYIFVPALAVAVIQQFFEHSRSSQRRIYWSCTVIGAVAAFLMVDRDWQKGLAIASGFIALMAVVAYANTPYIKIGGRIYPLTVQDSRPDPGETSTTAADAATATQHDPAPNSYGGLLTATKMWWLLILMMVISTGNMYAFATGEGEWWGAAIGLAFLVFLSVAIRFGDASWGYGIARGQRVQFVIAAIVTVGVFAALYLAAYQTGKHWPLRRKHSTEYRAHPRHQKLD